ncbi:MAG: hypothetical protein AAB389_03540 [Patescibacteria group bacterium]
MQATRKFRANQYPKDRWGSRFSCKVSQSKNFSRETLGISIRKLAYLFVGTWSARLFLITKRKSRMLVAKSQLINPALFGTCQKSLNPEIRWKVDAQKFPSAGQADSDIMEIGQRPLDAV